MNVFLLPTYKTTFWSILFRGCLWQMLRTMNADLKNYYWNSRYTKQGWNSSFSWASVSLQKATASCISFHPLGFLRPSLLTFATKCYLYKDQTSMTNTVHFTGLFQMSIGFPSYWAVVWFHLNQTGLKQKSSSYLKAMESRLYFT